MSYSTQGASNRQVYDCCKYAQDLKQSVDPLQYNLYFGAQENCSKCIDDQAWYRQDREVVDVESELWNITRPLSDCDQYKYNPNCKTSDSCISTFSESVPKILSPSLCPIVYNNIPTQTSPGYTLPSSNICGDTWRKAADMNTYKDYEKNVNNILENSKNPENVYMFLNNCNQQPLYNGSMEKVKPYFSDIYNSAPYLNTSSEEMVSDDSMPPKQMNNMQESFSMAPGQRLSMTRKIPMASTNRYRADGGGPLDINGGGPYDT